MVSWKSSHVTFSWGALSSDGKNYRTINFEEIFCNDFEHFSDVSALEIGDPGARFAKVSETFWVLQNPKSKSADRSQQTRALCFVN